MATATYSSAATIAGHSFQNSAAPTGDGNLTRDVSLAAAKTGTLTTRTSDTAGTLTMASGHGFTDGQIIDIYWATGQCTRATIGTVATNSVPFTGAGGDVLPIATTAIKAMVQRVETLTFADAALVALALGAAVAACSATFLKADGSIVGRVLVDAAADGVSPQHYIWHSANGATIPVSDDVAEVCLTHGDSDNTRTVVVAALVA